MISHCCEIRCLENSEELEMVRKFPRQQPTKMSLSWSEGMHPTLHCFHLLFPGQNKEPLSPGSCELLGCVPTLHHCLGTEKGQSQAGP